MEDSQENSLKFLFVFPGWLSFISSIYSFLFWDDILSKVLVFHIALVGVLPTLIEFTSFTTVCLSSSKIDQNKLKIAILLYLCITIAIFGVGILASVSAVVSLLAAIVLILYQFKNQISGGLGYSSKVPDLEKV